mgnify:FL=1
MGGVGGCVCAGHGFVLRVWVWGAPLVCLVLAFRFVAGSGLPARSLFALAMLQDLCAGASPPVPPPSFTGVMWSACQGSWGLGPSPHIQQRVAVARIAADASL